MIYVWLIAMVTFALEDMFLAMHLTTITLIIWYDVSTNYKNYIAGITAMIVFYKTTISYFMRYPEVLAWDEIMNDDNSGLKKYVGQYSYNHKR